jgi:4-amino-4-deoxy-L-arabinose transferase-like glycosyltransferase
MKKYFEKISISHIILTSLSLHLLVIASTQIYSISDENIFLSIMRFFLEGEDHAPYQLPGLSLIVAPFVYLFGDSWFAWRLPIIGFNIVFLYFFFKVLLRYTTKNNAILISIIVSFDTLIFVHSSLMVRDIPILALGFMSLYLFFNKKYYSMGLVLGTGAIIKETMVFFLLFIISYYIITNYRNCITKISSRKFLKTPFVVFCIIGLSFLIPLTIYDNMIEVYEYEKYDVGGTMKQYYEYTIGERSTETPISTIKDPFSHLEVFLFKGYFSNVSEDNSKDNFFNSIIPFKQQNEIFDATTEKFDFTNVEGNVLYISKVYETYWGGYNAVNPIWFIGFYGTLGLIVFSVWKRNDQLKNTSFLLAGIVTMFVPYLLISLIRDTWTYYFIYSVPIISLGMILLTDKIKNEKLRQGLKISMIVCVIVSFVYYFPIRFIGA